MMSLSVHLPHVGANQQRGQCTCNLSGKTIGEIKVVSRVVILLLVLCGFYYKIVLLPVKMFSTVAYNYYANSAGKGLIWMCIVMYEDL